MTATQTAKLRALLADLTSMCTQVETMNEKTRERIARTDEVLAIAARHG